MKPYILILTILIFSFVGFGQANKTNELLTEGKKVFVEKSEKDADVAMIKELQDWNRWKVVGDQSEADILIRLRVSGSAAWGVGHVQAFILDARNKETIWTSKDQKGMRTVFGGYASPFTRAISGIVKQMKKEFKDKNVK